MSEMPTGYFPENVEPYDPVLAESIKGKEQQIKAKAEEIISAAGVVQLPNGREGPTALIMGGDTIVQSFSSSEDVVFQTVTQTVGKRDEYVREHIGDREFRIFYVIATKEGSKSVFLTLLNPVKAAVYQRLLAEKSSEDGGYTADEFQRDEFARATPEEIRNLVEKYLESQPRQDLADEHFNKLTRPGSRLPGGGQIKKLY